MRKVTLGRSWLLLQSAVSGGFVRILLSVPVEWPCSDQGNVMCSFSFGKHELQYQYLGVLLLCQLLTVPDEAFSTEAHG